MLVLQTLYRDTVALDSIKAMTLRLIVWVVILGLMYAGSQKRATASCASVPLCTGLEPAEVMSESIRLMAVAGI